MPDWGEITPHLEAKLDIAHVKPPSKFGPKGDYIEGWHAIAEANRIFGFGEWSYDLLSCACVSERERGIGREQKPGWGVTYTATVSVRVGGVRRDDVGAGHGYDVDCGLAHESAIKEAVTDALKRALRTFGNPFGLALYDKSRENVERPGEKPASPAPSARPAEQKPPAQPEGRTTVDQPASADAPGQMLTKAQGDAIIFAVQALNSWREIDEYVGKLSSGPMAFAANHPKIKVAIAERRSAVRGNAA